MQTSSLIGQLILSSKSSANVTLALVILLHGQVERLRRKLDKMRNEINDCKTRLRALEDEKRAKTNDPRPV